jgi:hypothetical protein
LLILPTPAKTRIQRLQAMERKGTAFCWSPLRLLKSTAQE